MKQNRIQLKCQRLGCLHIWFQRGKEKPKVCPLCKRYDWFISGYHLDSLRNKNGGSK